MVQGDLGFCVLLTTHNEFSRAESSSGAPDWFKTPLSLSRSPTPQSEAWKSMGFFLSFGSALICISKTKTLWTEREEEEKNKKRNSVMSGYWNVANGILVIQTSCVKCRNITDRPRLEHFGRISSKLVSIENFQPSNAWCCTLGLKRSLIVCWKGYRMVSELNEFELMCGS